MGAKERNQNNFQNKYSYHSARMKGALNRRFKRRTDIVIESIKKYQVKNDYCILDIGCADGLMLSMIQDYFPEAQCIGLEYIFDLVRVNTDDRISLLQGNAVKLPFRPDTFDFIIASGVIDYLPEPEKMLSGIHNLLTTEGVLIITSPDPFWIKIASKFGQLKDGISGHDYTMSMNRLIRTLHDNCFDMLEAKKFMIPSNRFCNNKKIENFVRNSGLHFLFVNRILVCKKKKN